MAEVWSFGTTIRNPERMENMLRTLSEMEGINFDLAGQEMFFGLQIKKRLYRPTKSALGSQELISAVYGGESADDLGDEVVRAILKKYTGKVNASGRGRTAAGVLNRFGLCVARQSAGPVIITELGKKWLAKDIDDDELFTKFLLKWQYPNLIESGYASFNIKPFIAVISLIERVNLLWADKGNKPVGLSKDEYKLFAPALTTASQIEQYASDIINFRLSIKSKSGKDRAVFIKGFARQRAETIWPHKSIDTVLSDLRDYSDSSLRYFRMSGLIAERGGKTHIDIAMDKQVEVNSLLANVKPEAEQFSSYEDYFSYLSDIDSVDLPWQNEADLKDIVAELTSLLQNEAKPEKINIEANLESIKGKSLIRQVEDLQAALNDIRIQKLRNLKNNLDVLDECIEKLNAITNKQYQTLTARPSLDFEWYAARSLMVLNDATSIDPSFKIGEDGMPTGFRANVADIECVYAAFGMTVEVTLLLGRDQWIAEGQPVMRHLRDFEDKCDIETNYCLFIAPFIHRDALNTFWGSNKFSYEGRRQNIIPLSLSQFIEILSGARQKIVDGQLNHKVINSLLNKISQGVNNFDNPHDWQNEFSNYILKWR